MFGTKWWWYLHNTVNVLNATELHIFSLNGEFYVKFTTIKWKSTNQKGLIACTMCWAHGKRGSKNKITVSFTVQTSLCLLRQMLNCKRHKDPKYKIGFSEGKWNTFTSYLKFIIFHLL